VQLRWKLSLAYLVGVLVVVAAIALTIRGTAVDAVDSHMGGMMAEMHRAMMGETTDIEQAVTAGINQAILIGLGVAALVALLTSLAASAWITRPLGHLADVAARIADGDYGRRVHYEARDEVGQFSRAFNEMASKLEATEQLRRELLATISHELRTPLTNIEGYMEALLDGVMPDDPETYQIVRKEAQRLSRLVSDIERVSRLEAGVEPIEPALVRVGDVVRQAVEAMRPRFEEKGLELTVDSDGSGQAWLDPDKGVQVLTNLLQNSLRYTPSHGQVRVVVRSDSATVRFAVEDSGIGIDPWDLPHIFERFYRADKSRSSAGGGAGIGLAVVKNLVEQMGGRIWAESEPGRGTRVSFTMPVQPPAFSGQEY
jgi:two-component system, OmpR family, sensor histidine kinase BaeS